jgi:hypothetical protein
MWPAALRWALLALPILVLAPLAILAVVPRDHVVELVAVWPSTPPPRVWQLLTDHAAEPTWFPAFESVERRPDDHGRPVWTYRLGGTVTATMMTTSAIPERHYERLLLRAGQPRSQPWDVRWVFEIEPAGAGTRMKLTELGWTGGVRFFVVQRILGSPHELPELYLRKMGDRLGEPTRIEVVRTH